MTNLTINIPFNRRLRITDEDGGHTVVLDARAKSRESPVRLYDAFGKYTDVQIRVKRWFIYKTLEVPTALKNSILEFLDGYCPNDPDMDFDCYQFAVLVCGMPKHTADYAPRFWNLSKLNSEPQVSQIILLVTGATRQFHHAAVYLGLGYYLSVRGAGGGLMISSIGDLKRDY